MKNKNIFEGIVLMLLSSFFISESLKLKGAEKLALSPALFPLIITSFLLLFSIVLIIRAVKLKTNKEDIKKDKKESIKSNTKEEITKVSLVILISFIYLTLLSKFHFIVSSILYLLSFLLILGERRWKVFLPISIIAPLIIHFVFLQCFLRCATALHERME